MNDFTKEELEELLTYLKFGAFVDSARIVNKIQRMIENYCEHEHTLLSGFACAKCGYIKLPVFDSVMYVKPECQHKTDGTNYNNITNEPDFHSSGRDVHLKCKLCGKSYAYEHCQHESEDIHEIRTDYFNINKCIKCGGFYE